MRKSLRSSVALLFGVAVLRAALAAQAQEPIVRPSVAFEVASIKRNKSVVGPSDFFVPPRGNVSGLGVMPFWLIAYAYDINHHAGIKGHPDWLLSEYYDVRAIPPEDVPRDRIPLMMQSLLMDRFTLRAHWEMRDQPIYSLELAREDGTLGPDLKPSKHDCAEFWARGGKGTEPDAPRDDKGRPICSFADAAFGRLSMGGWPWSELFVLLASQAESFGGLGRPVVDNTGLSGHFDMHLEFGRPGLLAATLTEFKPEIREAVQKQLGLKLVSKVAPWKVLVIDSVERPTPD